MSQITLPDQTVEKLEQFASSQGTNATEILLKLVEDYLADNMPTQPLSSSDGRFAKIETEQKHYEATHATLLNLYRGQYIAMHDGEVVDHDFDRVGLSRRVRSRYGKIPVLIVQVRDEPQFTIYVRSPRIVKAAE